MGAQLRIKELLRADAFPHAVDALQLRETHISWVILTGPFAYKVKKPVHFDFLDASTAERRAALCEEELRLNQRLAPDLYLDVVPITLDEGRPRIGGDGDAIEHAVRMRQFDPDDELAARLDRGTVDIEDVSAFAKRLSELHQSASVAGPDSDFGRSAMVQRQMRDNIAALRSQQLPELEPLLQRAADWTSSILARLDPVLALRHRSGRVRECNGDLHAGNIVFWQQQWLAFDCLEFDPALRWIDVMSDVAFLYMDLDSRGRGDLASVFLNRYLEETGDYAGLRVLRLYAVYRALIRAKVDALAAQGSDASQARERKTRALWRARYAMQCIDAPAPALVIMHGVTASGKSWLSEKLVPALQAARIRSDLERKRLAGVAPLAHRKQGVDEGPYAPDQRRQVYAHLRDCAAAALEGGCNVIIDASFLRAADRAAFRGLADQYGSPFAIVACEAGNAELQQRIAARERRGRDPSEADAEVLAAQQSRRESLTGSEQSCTITIDTSHGDALHMHIDALKALLGALRDESSA